MSPRSFVVLVPLTLALAGAGAPAVAHGSAVGSATSFTASPGQQQRGGDAHGTTATARMLLPDPGKVRARLTAHPGYHASLPQSPATAGSVAQCGPTAFDEWLAGTLGEFTSADFELLSAYAALDLPAYEALLFGTSGDARFALGADAKALTKAHRKLRRFPDGSSQDIQLLGMHGEMLLDRERVARVYRLAFAMPDGDAEIMADGLAAFLTAPRFRGGRHPIFTLNAFAMSFGDEEVPEIGKVPDKIVMGDGILQAYREMGYGDVAPQTILAHEFAHHVQFELGVVAPDTPEGTRRTELHADAAAAYFLSHPRGASMQWKRVRQFLVVFSVIGDCQVESPGHHGTPAQRMRAADWGYRLQERARPKGHVVAAEAFLSRFEGALPDVLAAHR